MASLFQIERSVITKHINNIFKTGELDKKAVCAKLAHTAAYNKVSAKATTSFFSRGAVS
jgi:hypothetical protein